MTVALWPSIRSIAPLKCPRSVSTARLMAPISSFLALSFFWLWSSLKSSSANVIASSAIFLSGFTIISQTKNTIIIQMSIVMHPQKIEIKTISSEDFMLPLEDFNAVFSSAVITKIYVPSSVTLYAAYFCAPWYTYLMETASFGIFPCFIFTSAAFTASFSTWFPILSGVGW